ncbi:MAG TPA: transglycosylase SLT domain-containing protein, partial [Myxococcaceae bacterium]|nr:transglycosylase SLT domain-containing protein [Myxococcaceae bacterium]
KAGDYAAASSELTVLAGEYPAMRDHCLYFAGLALDRQRKLKPAIASYDAVSPQSSLFAEARFAMVRVLRRKWDFHGAVAALKPLRELPATPRYDAVRRRTLMEIIDMQRGLGNYPAEYRAMIELWATSPLSREAERLWTRLKQQPVPNPWRLTRAESFLSFHDNDEAIRLASQVRTLPPEDEACRAAFIVGNGHRKERRHRKAIAALAPLVSQCLTHPLRPQAMYVMGYSQSVVDRPNGIRTYEALARDYPNHPFADDALFFAAELYARLDQTRAALEVLEKVASRYPSGNFTAEALFHLGWLHRKRGDVAEAARAFERLEQSASAEHEDQLRARYWRARVLDEGRDGASLALYRRLAAEDPTTWYGLLARSRVGPEVTPGGNECALKTCASPSAWPREAGPLASDPRFLAGVELLRMGLREAGAELMRIDRRALPPDSARLLMDVFAMAGQERRAARVARAALGQHLRGGIDGESQKVWEAVYPIPFRDLVEKHAAKAKVDPDLVQALMREESRFNVRARSPTGALGLTQLMPQTARKVAAALKMGGVGEASLFRPEVNIRLGATYLGMLVAELNGSVPHAVAAYNAGPYAVRKWLRVRGGVEIDAWVEEIPFAETRDYVKRVLASYAAYQLVYRGQTSVALVPRLPAAASPAPTTLSSGARAR